MLKEILEALKFDFENETESIKIAKGKYKLPETFREALQPLKKLKWHKK